MRDHRDVGEGLSTVQWSRERKGREAWTDSLSSLMQALALIPELTYYKQMSWFLNLWQFWWPKGRPEAESTDSVKMSVYSIRSACRRVVQLWKPPPLTLFWCRNWGSAFNNFYNFPKTENPTITPTSSSNWPGVWRWQKKQGCICS